MAMTLLQFLVEFTARRGLDTPSAAIGSTDQTVVQMVGLSNECMADITNRGESWPRLQKQGHWTTVATEQQVTIAAAAPYGFKYLILDTAYDRTERRPLFGPRNAPRWQESEALPQTGPFYSYRIWQGYFNLQPAPPDGHEIYFEYASDMAILAVDGTTWKKRFTADDDSFALDEDLLFAGLNWRWRREQGLSYGQEKLDYEALISQFIGTTSTKGEVNMANMSNGDIRPGIFVPLGNWPVS